MYKNYVLHWKFDTKSWFAYFHTWKKNHKSTFLIKLPVYKIVILTKTKHVSTKQNVPDLPMPAEQCTMAGPTSSSRLPLSRTAWRYSKKLSGHCGTPKSGQVV